MNIFTQSAIINIPIIQIIRTLNIFVFFLIVSVIPVIASNVYPKDAEIVYKIKVLDLNLVVFSPNTLAAKFKITGNILSVKSSETLKGVCIREKGTTIATITDANGAFTIQVSSPNAILEVSYPGYEKQEVAVNNTSHFTFRLDEAITTHDEVVVVAFGTQKKTDLVGSVTSIKMSDLRIPSSNLTTALAGRVAGIIAYQRSGEPGQDNADFFIRGVTTFGYKTSPLILIDGMQMSTKDLARLQPDDISSFSVLKDATSSALYGARGANGVILITTKQGRVGKPNISFRIENSFSAPTKNIELADPVTYMKMSNEAILTRNPLGIVLYSDEKIANTAAGLNPIVYPANDWNKILFRDNTTTQRINLNVSGGGSTARYFVSGSYSKDNGMMNVDKRNNFNNNIDLKSYTLRSNISINVTKTTEVIVRLSGNFDDYQGPITGGADMYKKVMISNPVLFPAYYPVDEQHKSVNHIMFGNYYNGGYINPYIDMMKGYKDYSSSLMMAQVEAKQDLSFLTKGLTFRTMVSTNRNSYFEVARFYNPHIYVLYNYNKLTNTYTLNNINGTLGTDSLNYSKGPTTLSSANYLESMLNYARTYKEKHSFTGLLVYTMRTYSNETPAKDQESLPYKNLGLSGRTTYAYDNRYFAEFNFGYTGSEQFQEKHRFGFFPSVGLAWSISNEKFFEPAKSVVSNLRFRATYGLIGNDAISANSDRFFYLSNVNMNDPTKLATFGRDPGGYTVNGIRVFNYGNENITWETSTQKNIALEIGLFNKINIQAEYYTQIRDNILMYRAYIPVTMGVSTPIRANIGAASGKGTDLSMDYTESFRNGLSLSVRGNFTYATSQIRVYEEPQYKESYRSRVGNSIYQTYGYIADGLFSDEKEVANWPKQNFGTYGVGDIKYSDVNKDGQITAADMVPIGNPSLPEIIYGFGFSASYKGFDVSTFFQGLANESFCIDPVATSPFQNQTQVLKAYADNYWSANNPDVNALWPRLSPTLNTNNTQTSTWFMRDGSFLRLKQVEIGYALPKKLQNKINTSNFRIFINANNLLNFSKFNLWDVEMGGNGLGYPLQKVVNIGLNVNFN